MILGTGGLLVVGKCNIITEGIWSKFAAATTHTKPIYGRPAFCTGHRLAGTTFPAHPFWHKECKENYQSVQNCCRKEVFKQFVWLSKKKIPRFMVSNFVSQPLRFGFRQQGAFFSNEKVCRGVACSEVHKPTCAKKPLNYESHLPFKPSIWYSFFFNFKSWDCSTSLIIT